jgi:hypothetical protein
MAYKIGDVVRFDCSFDYQGPKYSNAKIRCVVGVKGVTFNEIDYTQQSLVMPERVSWDRFDIRVLVTLKNVQLGKVYDCYAKIEPETGAQAIFWYGLQRVPMEAAVPGTEFRNLEVVIS